MKTYLIDPNKKWCKANLHCHTVNSDGFFTPAEIKKHYMDHGYSIVAFSEHNVIYDVSYLTDENFVAITSTEYSIEDKLAPANDTYNKGEALNWRDMKVMHLSLFSKDPHNVFHVGASKENFSEEENRKYLPDVIKCDGHHRVFTQESIQETIDRANKAGFLVQLNHPNWSLNTREDYINLKGLWGLEILNYLTEIETGAELCINVYDDMLRNGHKINCTMGDDNHNYGGSFEGSFGGFNYIGVNKLTYDEVLSSMEKGDIYASNGPVITSLSIDRERNEVHVECSEAIDIILVGYNRTFYHVYGEDLKGAIFTLLGNEVYFRIVVKDKYGKAAYTHAYYLKDYGYNN